MSKVFENKTPEEIAIIRARMSEKKRQAWLRGNNGFSTWANGGFKDEVKLKISDSIKKRWEEGIYKDRLNGMTNITGSHHSSWLWGKRNFRDILLQFENPICAYCGEEETLNVHHIDENHDNYLLSNLQWVCVPCHAYNMHYHDTKTRVKLPFVTLSKKFGFEYAHILPWHPGKCQNLHGHSGHLEVEIQGRINTFGIVQDFYDISTIVKQSVIEVFDHKFLNDFIDNPTTENLLVEIWLRLEFAGLKGLRKIKFSETDSSSASLTYNSMVESFGWDRNKSGQWVFVSKLAHEVNQEKISWCMGHALSDCKDKQNRLHGHNWIAVFEYDGYNEEEMTIFRQLQGWIIENWDYKMMVNYNHPILIPFTLGGNQFSNDILDLGLLPVSFNPTKENICNFLYDLAINHLNLESSKLKVTVHEEIL